MSEINKAAPPLSSVSTVSQKLIRFYGFDIYGESMMERPVAKYLTKYGWGLTFVSCVNFWAWRNAWSYAVDPWTATFLGFVCALLIAYLDISIATADTSAVASTTKRGWSKLFQQVKVSWGRVLAIVLGSYITSVPIAMGVFSKEIETKLAATSDTITELDAKRATMRKELVDGYQVDLAKLESRTTEANSEMVKEAGIGQGKLGGKKVAKQGARYHAWLDQRTQLTDEKWLDKKTNTERRGLIPQLKSTHQSALEKFDNDTIALKEQARDAAKVKSAQWGFKDRYQAFSQLRADKGSVTNRTAWGCQLAFMFIELMVLFLKLNAPPEVETYFSSAEHAQERKKREDAKRGPEEEKAKVKAVEERQKQEALSQYRAAHGKVVRGMDDFLHRARHAARKASDAVQARGEIDDLWMEHVVAVQQEMHDAEAALMMLAVDVPKLAWERGSDSFHKGKSPRDMTEAQLVELVWGQKEQPAHQIFPWAAPSRLREISEIVAQASAALKPPSNGGGKPIGVALEEKPPEGGVGGASLIATATLADISRFADPRSRPRRSPT